MARYIDAELAESTFRDTYCQNCTKWCPSCDIDCVISDLDDIPTADVQEIKHGHWINDGYAYSFHPLNNLNDLYEVLLERQEYAKKNKASFAATGEASDDYMKGYIAGLQYAKCMAACTDGFELGGVIHD